MMLHYHTLNTLNAMNNQINGISPKIESLEGICMLQGELQNMLIIK